jgi:hypothetical protein
MVGSSGTESRITSSLGIKKRVAQNLHMDQKVFFNELYFDWLRAFASGYRIGVGVVLNITTHKYIINHITYHIYTIVFHLKDSSLLQSAIELPQTCPKLAQKVPKKCSKRKCNF